MPYHLATPQCGYNKFVTDSKYTYNMRQSQQLTGLTSRDKMDLVVRKNYIYEYWDGINTEYNGGMTHRAKWGTGYITDTDRAG